MPVKTIAKKPKIAKRKNTANSVLKLLLSFDQSFKDSYKHLDQLSIIGVDEVGIGCLAGPVVAAATILPVVPAKSKLARDLSKLNDSKKLNHDIRKELAYFIQQHAQYSIASASVEEIDELNILQAGLLAMKRSVADLMTKLLNRPENIIILVDGNKKIPNFDHEQICIIQGDSKSASIAAASVIAKVFRDEWMCQLSSEYPHYLWHSNKGYGSSAHRQAISEHGLCIWHRRSFV
jgi:ribonuclease HII